MHLDGNHAVGGTVGRMVGAVGEVADELLVDPDLDARHVAGDPRADTVPLLAPPRLGPWHHALGVLPGNTRQTFAVDPANRSAGQVIHRHLVGIAGFVGAEEQTAVVAPVGFHFHV